MCTRTRDMYHEESEETLLMSLMNEGWTREYAEKLIERKKEEAYRIGEGLVNDFFPIPE